MVEVVNSYMTYLIPCKNLCKCHIVPSYITAIREKNEKLIQRERMIERERETVREREKKLPT
jgi:hypothetical protein